AFRNEHAHVVTGLSAYVETLVGFHPIDTKLRSYETDIPDFADEDFMQQARRDLAQVTFDIADVDALWASVIGNQHALDDDRRQLADALKDPALCASVTEDTAHAMLEVARGQKQFIVVSALLQHERQRQMLFDKGLAISELTPV